MAFDEKLKSPKEQPLFIIGMIFSSAVWLAIAITVIGLVYAVMAAVAVLMAHALYLAHVRGNGLKLSERQRPEVYERFKAASARLGLDSVPDIYIMQSGGILNAFATKLLSRKFVIILSELVDNTQDPRQLDFVVGHELGHLAAGHLAFRAFLLPFHLVPWLGPAYSRACEYTCDRCGLEVAQDLEQSKRALVVLAAGGKQAMLADVDAFAEQQNETGSFWMAVFELVSSHPYLCKRVVALEAFSSGKSAVVPPRSIFAYVFAPVFGISAGGASGAVMAYAIVIGILVAIAIPNFKKFQERSRAAEMENSPSPFDPAQNPDFEPSETSPDLNEPMPDTETFEELNEEEGDPQEMVPEPAPEPAPRPIHRSIPKPKRSQ